MQKARVYEGHLRPNRCHSQLRRSRRPSRRSSSERYWRNFAELGVMPRHRRRKDLACYPLASRFMETQEFQRQQEENLRQQREMEDWHSRVSPPKLFIQDACFFNAPVWLSDSQELKEAMFNCSSTDTETLKSLIPTAQTPNPEDVGLRRRRHYDRNGCKHDRIAGARAAALESLC